MARFIKFTTALFVFYWVNMSLAQQTDYVDFKRASAMLGFNIDTLGVDGQVSYQFDVLNSVDSIFIDAVNMCLTDDIISMEKLNFSGPSQDKQLYPSIHFSSFIP